MISISILMIKRYISWYIIVSIYTVSHDTCKKTRYICINVYI